MTQSINLCKNSDDTVHYFMQNQTQTITAGFLYVVQVLYSFLKLVSGNEQNIRKIYLAEKLKLFWHKFLASMPSA